MEQFFSSNVEVFINLVVVLSAGKDVLDFGKFILQEWQDFFVVVGMGQLCGLVDVIFGDVSAQSVCVLSYFIVLVGAFISGYPKSAFGSHGNLFLLLRNKLLKLIFTD